MPSAPAQQSTRQKEIADILRGFRSTTVLRRDELIAEYVDIERNSWTGQNDQAPAGGNTDKGISKAARELDIPGKTKEGRRKFVERAPLVASIPQEAKTAAIEGGLDNKRSALLAIAQAGTVEKALLKIEELKKHAKEPKKVPDLSEYKESVSAVEAAWQRASELRRALHDAPPPVRNWFGKHLLPAVEA